MKDVLLKNRIYKAGAKVAAFAVIISLSLVAFTACANPQSGSGDESNAAVEAMDAATASALTSASVAPGAPDAIASPPAAAPDTTSPEVETFESVSPPATTADSVKSVTEESAAETSDKTSDKKDNAKDKNSSSNPDKEKTKEKAEGKAEKKAEEKDKKKDDGSDKKKASTSKTDKDSDKTENVDKPKTEDAQPKPETGTMITVSIAADCLTLFDSDPELAGYVSNNGVILDKKDVTIADGDTVYDVIKASGVTFVGKTYLSSIGGLSEGDVGAKSGWMYSVNGAFPAIGVTSYKVKDGDVVQFRYTLNGGADVK
jgi:hypothetical protein